MGENFRNSGVITLPFAIPIKIYPFFWVVVAVISFLSSSQWLLALTVWVPIICFSILIHEYGHALTAKAFGQQAEIELVGFGGMTKRTGKVLGCWQNFLIVLNGPLAGFFLALVARSFYLTLDPRKDPLSAYTMEVAFYINLFWTIFNLFPIYPLDGGHLLRYALQGFFGLTGLKVAFFLSIIFAAIGSILFFSMQNLLIGSIFLLFVFESYRSWRYSLQLSAEDQLSNLQEELAKGKLLLETGEIERAEEIFLRLVQETKKGVIHLEAIEKLSYIYFKEKRYEEAYALLKQHMELLSLESLQIAQIAAYSSKKYDESIEIGEKIWREEVSGATACYNSLSYAAKEDAERAVSWLGHLAEENPALVAEIVQRAEFDKIRFNPTFSAFAAKFSSG